MATISRDTLFEFLIRLADDHMILGHRLSEWCGHAPMLEEDLAMPNMALDLIGQARLLYAYAGEVEGKGRSEDDLAYVRREHEYKNCLLAERPNGDFAHTMLRQLYFAAFMEPFWKGALTSTDETVAAIAAKAVKEVTYHIRHAGEWIIRLGDGTDDSAERMRAAVTELHRFTGELFETNAVTDAIAAAGIAPDPASLRAEFDRTVATIFSEALLEVPDVAHEPRGGRDGVHGEEMGFILAELQHMQRTYPGATW